MLKRKVTIYTDGACDGNPGPGGYGAVIMSGRAREEISQGYRRTTNNRMELLAAVEALETLNEPCEVTLYSDSKYLVEAMERGWALRWRDSHWQRKGAKRVPNADLWQRLLDLLAVHEVQFKWVRGHAGNPHNERADFLSYQTIEGEDLLEDVGYLQQLELERIAPTGITEQGQPCRKCGTPVIKGKPKRKSIRGQSYFYEYYLRCPECGTLYMVEGAKRAVNQGSLFDD
jgi:ribonuclease HI